ncbi:hypothetical protein ACFCYH_19730 [Streptomyces sp. NPDC056400]|uniref:hypothetical protein n=1 Tax=Streptomyces sp. NPDC056400 TaxID=3345808 RepID=UPI0035D98888
MNIVHVTGVIQPDGHFTPGWWGTAPEGVTAPPGPDSGWAAVAVDDTGRTLVLAPAHLQTVPVCPGSGESAARLTAFLPLPDGAAAIAVRHHGAEVFRRTVPAPATVSLELSAVQDERLPRDLVVEVPVRIDGPQPPPGAHLVVRWEAPGSGHPAVPLGLIDVGGGEPAVVRLDLADLPVADLCRLTVSYSDGSRTVTVSSPVLAVERRPARPEIETPQPGTALFEDGLLLLEGRLDGDGDPAALQWLLDAETVGHGPRAFVARPGSGEHTVSLQYGAERHQIEIRVRHAPPTPPRAPRWDPPWRTGPVRSVGVAHPSDDSDSDSA